MRTHVVQHLYSPADLLEGFHPPGCKTRPQPGWSNDREAGLTPHESFEGVYPTQTTSEVSLETRSERMSLRRPSRWC